jgi:hypothetical protein
MAPLSHLPFSLYNDLPKFCNCVILLQIIILYAISFIYV